MGSLRARQQRNLLATLLLSQGVPMLAAGDEIGRTQSGNNNAYCQDNRMSWVDWTCVDQPLLDFVRWLARFRRGHPVFRRRRWFQGRPIHNADVCDILWFTPDGEAMAEEHWGEGFAKALGIFLNGAAIPIPGACGERIVDDSFCILLNAHYEPLEFSVPGHLARAGWAIVLDTSKDCPLCSESAERAGDRVAVASRSLVVLQSGTAS